MTLKIISAPSASFRETLLLGSSECLAGSENRVYRHLVLRKHQMSGLAEQRSGWLETEWSEPEWTLQTKALEPVNALKQVLPFSVSDPVFLFFPFALPYNAICPIGIN